MKKITLENLVEEYTNFIRETAIKNPHHLDAVCNIADFAEENGLSCEELVQHDIHDIYNLGAED